MGRQERSLLCATTSLPGDLANERISAVIVRTSIVVDRPIEQVWAYIEDANHELQWRAPTLKRLNQTTAGPARAGTRYVGVMAMGPLTYPYVSELTEYQPPTRLAWKGVSSTGWVIGSRGSYTLNREGKRTRLTHEIEMVPNKLQGRLVMPLLGAMGSGAVRPMLSKLKTKVEAS